MPILRQDQVWHYVLTILEPEPPFQTWRFIFASEEEAQTAAQRADKNGFIADISPAVYGAHVPQPQQSRREA